MPRRALDHPSAYVIPGHWLHALVHVVDRLLDNAAFEGSEARVPAEAADELDVLLHGIVGSQELTLERSRDGRPHHARDAQALTRRAHAPQVAGEFGDRLSGWGVRDESDPWTRRDGPRPGPDAAPSCFPAALAPIVLTVDRRKPKARQQAARAKETQPPAATTLLLVEDDEFVRRALTRALNRTGVFAVLAAEHGAEALDVLAQQPVDAILTDLQMPVMDGLTFLSQLLERGSHLPVAVMTGQRITPELADRLHHFGIAATFTKPVDISALVDDLQRAVTPGTVGRIAGITLFGFLQLLEVERKTGVVVVHASGSEGRLYFHRGELVHGETRRQRGIAAVYEIVSWPDPKLELFYKRTPRERTITEPLQYVLMEAARLEDEGGAVRLGEADVPKLPGARDRGMIPAGVKDALVQAMRIDGAIGVALVDGATGLSLATAGDEALNWDLASAGAADSLQAHRRVMDALGPEDAIEDVMVTLGTQYHVIRRLGQDSNAFFYLVLNRETANLGMARQTLAGLARRLALSR